MSREPMICFRCKHYSGWHQHDTGRCEYRAGGVLCACTEFKEFA